MVSTPYKENGLMFQQACMTSELAPCLAMSHTELAPAAWQPASVPSYIDQNLFRRQHRYYTDIDTLNAEIIYNDSFLLT